MKRHIWTKSELEFLTKNFSSMTNRELAEKMNLTLRQITNKIHKLGLKGKTHNKTGKFEKNHKSWNQGLKGLPSKGRMQATQFKKGNLPHNTRKNGDISIRIEKKSGIAYKYIRISLAKWVLLHRFVWEQKYGKIPAKSVLIFKDGDQMNCEIENLEMISMAENLRRNYDILKSKETAISGIKELSNLSNDNYIASRITKNKELKKIIRNSPELLELKRNQIILSRKIRNKKYGRVEN